MMEQVLQERHLPGSVGVCLSVFDRHGRLLLRRFIDTLGMRAPIDMIVDRDVEPQGLLSVYNPFHTFAPDLELHELRYEFVLLSEAHVRIQADISVAPLYYDAKTDLILPLQGRVIVWDAHDYYSHHRRVDIVHPFCRQYGLTDNDSRYGYDFCLVNEDGEMFRQEGKAHVDWYGYGAPVYAPGIGRVAYAVDGEPDIVLGQLWDSAPPHNPDLSLGNQVIIDHQNGEYSVLCHFTPGSVTVREGDPVEQGQFIGRVGASGSSLFAHLHYHVRSGPRIVGSQGLPSCFRDYRRLLGARTLPVNRGWPHSGEIIER